MSRPDELRQIVRTLMRVMLISERTPTAFQHKTRYNPLDFHTLGILRAEPDLRATALAERLRVAPTTASSLIARLVKKGLIKREKSQEDGRAVALTLTADGQKLADAIHQQDLANMTFFLSALEEEAEQVQLIALLRKVTKKVAALERED